MIDYQRRQTKKQSKYRQTFFIFAILFFCVLLVVKNTQSDMTTIPNHTRPQEYMKSVSIWRFTEKGNLKHYLRSQYWEYSPEKQSSQLIQPSLMLYYPNNTQWTIQAKHGLALHEKLDSHIDKIDLFNNVQLKRNKNKINDSFSLLTEHLSYSTHSQELNSDEFVTLLKPDLKITGIGLIGNVPHNKIQIKNNVKTEYRKIVEQST